jgi:DNA-binding MarR family transcriptional regulator
MLDAMRGFLGTSDIPLQQVLTFAHVADRQELPMADLIDLTGVGQSSVSRNVAALSSTRGVREPGYGLVEAYEDPAYRRRKLVKLTARGRALVAEIEKSSTRYLK